MSGKTADSYFTFPKYKHISYYYLFASTMAEGYHGIS